MRNMLRDSSGTLRGSGIGFFAVLLALVLGAAIHIGAQSQSSFAKLNTAPVVATSFTTAAITGPTTVEFDVTAVDASGRESVPTAVLTEVIPTGSHTVALSWTAGAGDTAYNVYSFLVPAPVPPSGLQGVVNP
jgi:hypothetical protein